MPIIEHMFLYVNIIFKQMFLYFLCSCIIPFVIIDFTFWSFWELKQRNTSCSPQHKQSKAGFLKSLPCQDTTARSWLTTFRKLFWPENEKEKWNNICYQLITTQEWIKQIIRNSAAIFILQISIRIIEKRDMPPVPPSLPGSYRIGILMNSAEKTHYKKWISKEVKHTKIPWIANNAKTETGKSTKLFLEEKAPDRRGNEENHA